MNDFFLRINPSRKIAIDQRLWSIDKFAQKMYGHFLGGRLRRGKSSVGPRPNVWYVVEVIMVFRRVKN